MVGVGAKAFLSWGEKSGFARGKVVVVWVLST